METISKAIDKARRNATSVSSTTSQRKYQAVDCVNRYGNAMAFMSTFNPSMQCQYSGYLERVFMGNAPAIFTVKDAYGVKIAESWLEIQINDLSEFSGCKDKLSTAQIEQVAQVIIAEFGYMKITELMYFFMLFKAGRFGKFYGAVDGLVITTALQDFCEIRADKIREFKERRDDEQRKTAQIEHDKQAISYEEYCKLMDGNND